MKRKSGAETAYRKKKTTSKKAEKNSASQKTRNPVLMPPESKLSSLASQEHPDLDHEIDEENEEVIHEDEEQELNSYLPTVTPSPGVIVPTEILDTELAAISPTDPLRRYLEEVKMYPLLSPEAELALATQLRNTGDLHAAKALVSANLRLVVKIAFEYRSIYSNIMDLIQEGNIGLMKAVSKFDPTKGARLGYYASWWIRSYILKYLLDNFRLVKIGTTQAQKKLFYHLMREKERLEAQGLLAGPKLLAEKLNVREKDVLEMEQRLSRSGSEVSLDTPIDQDGEKTVQPIQLLEDTRERADDLLAREELIRLLKKKLPEFQKQLNEKELQILEERLLSEEPKTLQEVANRYRLTRERARQIEAKVIQKLREFLNLGD